MKEKKKKKMEMGELPDYLITKKLDVLFMIIIIFPILGLYLSILVDNNLLAFIIYLFFIHAIVIIGAIMFVFTISKKITMTTLFGVGLIALGFITHSLEIFDTNYIYYHETKKLHAIFSKDVILKPNNRLKEYNNDECSCKYPMMAYLKGYENDIFYTGDCIDKTRPVKIIELFPEPEDTSKHTFIDTYLTVFLKEYNKKNNINIIINIENDIQCKEDNKYDYTILYQTKEEKEELKKYINYFKEKTKKYKLKYNITLKEKKILS